MEKELLSYLITSSLTKNEALNRLRRLRDFLGEKLFGTAPPESAPDSDLQLWLRSLDPRLLEPINGHNIDQIMNSIEEAVGKIDPLIVFLSFEIERPQLEELVKTLRQSYGPEFLVEIKFDPNLIGGAALVWKGVYKDYSVHQRITDNREQIIRMFQKYIK